MGESHWKDQAHMIKGLGVWVQLTSGEGREAEHWVQSCCPWFNKSGLCYKSLIKTLNTEVRWNFLVGKHSDVQGEWHAWILRAEGLEALCPPTPPRPCPIHLFIWLALLVCILYNKTVIMSMVFSWVQGVGLVNHGAWRGRGNPWIYIQSVRNAGGLGTCKVWLATEIRAILLGTTSSNLWDLY